MPADNSFDLRVDKRIEDRIDFGAGNPEDMRHALHFQCANHKFGTDLLRFIYDLVHCPSPC
jgi:hypothetical protein